MLGVSIGSARGFIAGRRQNVKQGAVGLQVCRIMGMSSGLEFRSQGAVEFESSLCFRGLGYRH